MGHLDFDIVSDFDIRISDFASFDPLHLSRTLYKSALFMQNKPNFDKGQNKPNPLYKKDLRKFYTPSDNEKQTQNKPKTNPIKADFRKAQMNVNSLITKDYRKKDDFAVRKNKPNSNPNKPNLPEGKIDAKCVVTKDYEEKCG